MNNIEILNKELNWAIKEFLGTPCHICGHKFDVMDLYYKENVFHWGKDPNTFLFSCEDCSNNKLKSKQEYNE